MINFSDNPENLDLSYKKVENEFINDLNALSPDDNDGIKKRIDIFAEKHLVKSEIWSRYMTNSNIIFEKRVYHFDFNILDLNKFLKFLNRNIEEWHRDEISRIFSNNLESYIYPHAELVNEHNDSKEILADNYLQILQRALPKPLSKAIIEKFEKAVIFYKKMEELKADDKKWFEFIQEWDDEEFVIHNIEYRIGQNLQNKNLWKLYIEFWRVKNPKIMVGLYSRYCSFFLDDFEMRQEYEKEASKLGIFVNDRILDYKEFQSFPIPKSPAMKEYSIPKTNFSNYFPQYFPFHNFFMKYLMDNTKAEVLQKLFMSCKYFFKRQPTPVCHRLVCAKEFRGWVPLHFLKPAKYYDETLFDQQSLTIADDHPCLKDIKNLILSNSFYYNPSYPSSIGIPFNKIIPKIYRSEIKFLTVEHCALPIKEYLFLTESKTVLEMKLKVASVHNFDRSLVCLEDLMITLPNAYQIIIRRGFLNTEINFQSFDKISEMPRNTKIRRFNMLCHELSFNVQGFLKFLKKNITQDSHYLIKIVDVTDAETFKTNSCNIIAGFLKTVPEYNKKCFIVTGQNIVIIK